MKINEAVIGAFIEVYSGGIKRGGCATDVDGNYVIKPLAPGKYEVVGTYSDRKRIRIKEVVVTSDHATRVNFDFKPDLKEEVVIEYKAPLIPRDGKITPHLGGCEGGDRLPPQRDMSKLITTLQNNQHTIPRGDITTCPPRSPNTITVLDGIVLNGSIQVDTPKKKNGFFNFLKSKKKRNAK